MCCLNEWANPIYIGPRPSTNKFINRNYIKLNLNSKLNSCAEQPYIMYYTLILHNQLLANVLILSKKKSGLSEPDYTGIDAVTIG